MRSEISSELKLIFGILTPGKPLSPPEDTDSLDWGFIVQTLCDNRMAGFAYERLMSSHAAWPEAAMTELRGQYIANQFRNMLFLEEAKRIFHALESAGVKPVAMKGIALIDDIYGAGTRKLGDIDILVSPDEAAKSIEILRGLGFEQAGTFIPEKGSADLCKTIGGHSIPVDLSWKFLHRSKFSEKYRVDELMHRCVRKRIADTDVYTLNPVDFIVHTAAHAALHHDLAFMPGLVDIYLLYCRLNAEEIDALDRRALELGLLRPVSAILGMLYETFGLAISAGLYSEWMKFKRIALRSPAILYLDIYWIAGAEESAGIRTKKGGFRRNIARMFLRQALSESFGGRLTALIKPLWPSKERISKMYRPKGGLSTFFFTAIHMPIILLALISSPAIWFAKEAYALGLRKQLGGRVVGISDV